MLYLTFDTSHGRYDLIHLNVHEFKFALDNEKQASERKASVEDADVEPRRFCQTQAFGMSTLGVGMGGRRGTSTSAAAGKLALRSIFEGIHVF